MKRAVPALLLIVIALGIGIWYFTHPGAEPPAYQGYVEGNLVQMAPEEGGRIDRLLVDAGDQVTEGQLLFTLDATMQTAQVEEAKARLKQMQAQAENLRAAGQRPEQVAVLEAARERAQAAFDFSRGEANRQRTLFDRGYTSQSRLDQAEAALERDKAALQEAERQIEAARLSGRSAEIAAAEAAVHVAEAALQQAETRLAKRRVVSSVAAGVQDIFFRAGEVVNAGQPVLALLPPANLKIRFYVPETVLATLALGQNVTVTCDSCPADLQARITFISREAEFTPPVIFSEQERSKLVFRAEAQPLNEIALPVGLPISVNPEPRQAAEAAP
jgi:HlyD family secretion protein